MKATINNNLHSYGSMRQDTVGRVDVVECSRQLSSLGRKHMTRRVVLFLYTHVKKQPSADNFKLCSGWERTAATGMSLGGHNISCLQWASENGCDWTREKNIVAAANDHLSCLQSMRENMCPWDKETWRVARNGHLSILQWARENRCEWDEGFCRAIVRRLGVLLAIAISPFSNGRERMGVNGTSGAALARRLYSGICMGWTNAIMVTSSGSQAFAWDILLTIYSLSFAIEDARPNLIHYFQYLQYLALRSKFKIWFPFKINCYYDIPLFY